MADVVQEETAPEGEEKETGATSEELGDGGKRALEAERKARRTAEKLAKELQDKVKAAEDAEKTELERLQGQVAELTKSAEAATAQATRFEVAAAKGLSLAQARRLVGSTKEELESDADEMRAELGLKDEGNTEETTETTEETTPAIGARPKEDLHGGASNTADDEPDVTKLAESILKSPF
jgi:hypothetical protein